MDFHQERIRKQCIYLGIIALILVGILIVQKAGKSGGESQVASSQINRADQGETNTQSRTESADGDADGSFSGDSGGSSDGGSGEAGDGMDLLILVNKDNPLPDGYETELHWLKNGSCAVAEEMYGALQEMLTDGSVNGRQFVVASGYRDSEKQQQLLEEDIENSMQKLGLTWEQAYMLETRETMPPGYSEHETGLAVDIVALDYQILDEGQESTAENLWLRENCSRYGFILRYPKGKEDITGIDYESWHFRYVGKEAAQEITKRGITLEEYVEELE